MRALMADAEVGDDVYGEDPTVNELEAHVAQMLGMEAAMFVGSGTQSNLCGILAHCQRGDEYLVGQHAHTFRYEAGGAAVLGSIQPQPVELETDGTFDLDLLESYIKPEPNGYHFARTRLLCLENTHDGKPLPRDYLKDAQALARRHGLGLHLDGARLWNAVVAQGATPAELADGFDTVSVCLSKGLGAPVGSVLVGRADLVEEARRWRKMLGGGMRQAGILAAAGRYAVDHHVARLADDHRRAARLAEGLGQIEGLTVVEQNTSMVFVEFDPAADGSPRDLSTISTRLAEDGVIASTIARTRLVCHLDVSDEDVEHAIAAFSSALATA